MIEEYQMLHNGDNQHIFAFNWKSFWYSRLTLSSILLLFTNNFYIKKIRTKPVILEKSFKSVLDYTVNIGKI
uniref:Uncharacterized protein n=1 Tax=Rhizophagus irregularis (strain DAOM 181602 / DAOM 197198 / MUCL 43194) TaxID=747089 RepID=U9TEL7_RHIID